MTEVPQDTRLALGEILGAQKYIVKQLDDVAVGFKDFRTEMRADHAALSSRVLTLEKFQWKLLGLGSAGTVLTTIATSFVVWYITKGA